MELCITNLHGDLAVPDIPLLLTRPNSTGIVWSFKWGTLCYSVATDGAAMAYTNELLYDMTETLLGMSNFRLKVMCTFLTVTMLPLHITVAGELGNESRWEAYLLFRLGAQLERR